MHIGVFYNMSKLQVSIFCSFWDTSRNVIFRKNGKVQIFWVKKSIQNASYIQQIVTKFGSYNRIIVFYHVPKAQLSICSRSRDRVKNMFWWKKPLPVTDLARGGRIFLSVKGGNYRLTFSVGFPDSNGAKIIKIGWLLRALHPFQCFVIWRRTSPSFYGRTTPAKNYFCVNLNYMS